MLHTTLESIGFSDKQAKVYIAALSDEDFIIKVL